MEPWGSAASHSYSHFSSSTSAPDTIPGPTVSSVLDHHALGYLYDKELSHDHMRILRMEKEQKSKGLFVWEGLV